MKTLISLGAVMAFAMAATACAQTPEDESSTLSVSGRIDTRTRTLDNASALGIGDDGRTFSAYVERSGAFRLDLPVGHTYRIIIANATMAGELRAIGHLVNTTSNGKEDVIVVKEGGRMDLGVLRPATATAPKTGGLRPACDCDADYDPKGGEYEDKGEYEGKTAEGTKTAEDGKTAEGSKDGYGDKEDTSTSKDSSKSGGDDDYKSQQKDSDKGRVCEDSSDVELVAQKAPGDKCSKGRGAKDVPKPTGSCTAKDENHDGKDDGPQPSKTGSDTGSKETQDDGYGDKGEAQPEKGGAEPETDKSAPSPSSCTCSLQCGAGSSCFASKCVADEGDDASSGGK